MQPWFEKGQVAHKIQVGIADGQEGLKDLSKQGQSFDLVFIDADKPGYAAYYDLLFSHHLLSPNATIVADNTAFRGVPWVPSEAFGQENGTAMAQFNDKIQCVPRCLRRSWSETDEPGPQQGQPSARHLALHQRRHVHHQAQVES